ncbi:hypothetical protein ACFL0I_03685 [Gemmatimonadota bacterium]
MSVRSSILALVGLFLFVPAASAQWNGYNTPRAGVGINFVVGQPMDEFADFVEAAYGGELMGRFALDPTGILSLRGDLGFMIYGYDSKRVCFQGIGCRVEARLKTSNNIFYGGIGPELALPLAWARPYANAFMGFGYFNTSSSLESLWGDQDSFTTENFGDGTFSWGAGWGLELNVNRGGIPVYLDFGARYHHHGVMEYLTEGDLVDNPDGSVTVYPNRTEANLISYRFGVTIGFPRGGRDRDRGRSRR